MSRGDAGLEITSLIVTLRVCARPLLALYDVLFFAHFGAKVSTAPRTPPRRVSRLPLPKALKAYFISPQLMLDMGDARTGFSFRRRTPVVRPRPLAGNGAMAITSSQVDCHHSKLLTGNLVRARRWLPLYSAVTVLPISRPHKPRRSTGGELINPSCSTLGLMRPCTGEAAKGPDADRAATLKARARGATFGTHARRGITFHWISARHPSAC